MCILCENESGDRKYCDSCLDFRLVEIFKQYNPNQSEMVYDILRILLKMNYWTLSKFLEKYDTNI